MGCKPKKPKCGKNRTKSQNKNPRWEKYPSPEEEGFGRGKFCYFISHPKLELPIRDFRIKDEPHYENKSYNECVFCNQRGIRNLKDNGGSYIIFITKYQGTIAKYQDKYYITGWFPISHYKEIPNQIKRNKQGKIIYRSRMAYKSGNPIFLSVEDSIELNGKRWRRWFGEELPSNLRYMTKFIPKDQYPYGKNKNQTISEEIKSHFEKMEKEDKNMLQDYIDELMRS